MSTSVFDSNFSLCVSFSTRLCCHDALQLMSCVLFPTGDCKDIDPLLFFPQAAEVVAMSADEK